MFEFIGSIVKTLTGFVDGLVTSDEEKSEAVKSIKIVENQLTAKMLEYETKLMEQKASIIKVEAEAASWLQRNWRPIVMLVFTSLVVATWLGFDAPGLTESVKIEVLGIVKLGIGGYIVGRSVEKIAPSISDAFKKNGE